MPFSATYLSYRQTNSFSAIALDYTDNNNSLKSFYNHNADIDGIKNAIEQRKQFPTDRKLLVHHLNEQYKGIAVDAKLQHNIDSLLQQNTFTITTAHQPNIFTGHLYFIYKILHAIKMAEALQRELPGNNFVPVYYMGSEDADLEELGEVFINGQHYRWQTNQTGAVGRMKIDSAFIQLINAIEGQLLVEVHGKEIMDAVRFVYTLDKTIEQATFEFVHRLFADYGLVILLPDAAALKRSFLPIINKELNEQFSNKAVQETMKDFPAQYKVQAAGREINLFWLQQGSRERIEREGVRFKVEGVRFEEEQFIKEVEAHPERISPNVILRPVFQEWILPNIAFIGGGGELAYWLELKKVFVAAGTPYPVLILRNSFGIIPKKAAVKIASLELTAVDFFQSAASLLQRVVQTNSDNQLNLTEEKNQLTALYKKMQAIAGKTDASLQQHADALHTLAIKKITQLEKKMYRAEKKKFEAQQRQIEKIKSTLYPNGVLQERIDNLLPWYAKHGKSFIDLLYQNSLGLEQQFCLLEEN
ncbi:MAG: bacillithiol biosynthesis cysteine-adding enzyme BshC [Rhizobacter sp.]|nr:bacillithiol biosynthesis cysteine-adding enzyme BshC [Ferruginibacter sp.]